MANKLSITDYQNIRVYLEGVEVHVYRFMIQAQINSITSGWVDIPYDEKLLNIKYRDTSGGVHGLQPYTRIHIFSKINNDSSRLVMEGIVTGSTITNVGRKAIRVTFMDEFGALAAAPLFPYVGNEMLTYISNASIGDPNLEETVSQWSDRMNAVSNYISELLDTKKTHMKELFTKPETDRPETFYEAFIEGNPYLTLLDAILKLEYKYAHYNNPLIVTYMNNISSELTSILRKKGKSQKDAINAFLGMVLDNMTASDMKNMTVFKILVVLLQAFGLDYVPIINPAYLSGVNTHSVYYKSKHGDKTISVGSILHGIGLPNLTWCPPVHGNIFFADETGAEALPSYNFLSAPTRVFVKLGVTTGDAQTKQMLYGAAPQEFKDFLLHKKATNNTGNMGVDVQQSNTDVGSGAQDTTNSYNNWDVYANYNQEIMTDYTNMSKYLLDGEYYMGQNVASITLNDWFAQYLSGAVLSNAAIKPIKQYLDAYADYYYRIGYREASSMNIGMKKLNTDVILGLPGAVISRGSISVGVVTGVQYTGSPGSIMTTIKLNGLHPHNVTLTNRNPLASSKDLSDSNIDNAIYNKYFGTKKINDTGAYPGALEYIQKKYYGLKQKYLPPYIASINRRSAATLSDVNALYGNSFYTDKYLINMLDMPKRMKNENPRSVLNPKDAAFVAQRKWIIYSYKSRVKKARRH